MYGGSGRGRRDGDMEAEWRGGEEVKKRREEKGKDDDERREGEEEEGTCSRTVPPEACQERGRARKGLEWEVENSVLYT